MPAATAIGSVIAGMALSAQERTTLLSTPAPPAGLTAAAEASNERRPRPRRRRRAETRPRGIGTLRGRIAAAFATCFVFFALVSRTRQFPTAPEERPRSVFATWLGRIAMRPTAPSQAAR